MFSQSVIKLLSKACLCVCGGGREEALGSPRLTTTALLLVKTQQLKGVKAFGKPLGKLLSIKCPEAVLSIPITHCGGSEALTRGSYS